MKALAALVLLLGLTACSGGGDGGADDRDETRTTGDASSPSASSPPSSDPSASSPAEDSALDLADTEVCRLVREGIDAFNVGEREGTVEKFEEAIGPAEDLARDQPSDDTQTLLAAVRYYAELAPEDYDEALNSSPEFQRFQAFTLTECAYDSLPEGATDPAIPA